MFPLVFLLNLAADVQTKTVVMRSFPLNAYERKLDWQGSGIRVASDGNCYFACSSHAPDHGCSLFRYDPRADTVSLLCDDITSVCGEDPTRTPPQGKIRTDIVEWEGWLYFGTHIATYWREAEAAYTGGHVVGYEMATGKFRDFGIVRANYTIYSGIGLNRNRGMLYVYVSPYPHGEGPHLYRIDLKSGAKEDLGLVHRGVGAAYFLFVDGKGDCWFTSSGAGGALFRARSSDGRLDRWDNLLPPAYSFQNKRGKEGDPTRCMRWAQPSRENSQCLFTMEVREGSGDMLWLLETNGNIEDAFRPLWRIGPTGFGLATSQGRIYYVQPSYAKPILTDVARPIQNVLAKLAVKLASLGYYPEFHLRSISLESFSTTDHGPIVDQDGRTPSRIESITVDESGRLFMVGDWRLLPGERGTLLFDPRSKRYEELLTGQFFAVGRLEND